MRKHRWVPTAKSVTVVSPADLAGNRATLERVRRLLADEPIYELEVAPMSPNGTLTVELKGPFLLQSEQGYTLGHVIPISVFVLLGDTA